MVYSYSGELELRKLACGTIYANKTDIEKYNYPWETAWRKKRGDNSSRSKVLHKRLPPCSRPCLHDAVVWHRLLLCLDICVVRENCWAKDGSVSMHRFPRGPNLDINCCFFHEGTGLIPWQWSHQRKAATLRTSKGSSRAAPGISASVSSTDTGSEAMLVDDLLFASVSSRATLTRQNFRTGRAFSTLLSPHGFPRIVLYFYICFISINSTTGQHGQFKFTTVRIESNGKVLHKWTPEVTSR